MDNNFKLKFHKTENGFVVYQGGYDDGYRCTRERVAKDFAEATKEAKLMFNDWIKTQKDFFNGK
jgi:hypothetical protein